MRKPGSLSVRHRISAVHDFKRQRRQAALDQLEQMALSGCTSELLLKHAARQATVALRADTCAIFKYAPEQRRVLFCSGFGWKKDAAAQIQCGLDDCKDLLSGGFAFPAELLRPHWGKPAGKTQSGTRRSCAASLSAPIAGRPEPFGALNVYAFEGQSFSAADAEFLRAAAGILAQACFHKRAERKTSDFLATLSHELRTPLASLQSAAQILRRQPAANPVSEEAGRIIERQSAHLARLVDSLLEVSRVALGKVSLNKERLDLRVILRAAIDTCQMLFDARRHTLKLDLPGQALNVFGDPVRLKQVLDNLLNNAVKYTPDGGEIKLSAACDGQTVTIRVEDNGIGIQPEELDRIFTRYTQVRQKTAAAVGGLGIGLSLVRDLTALHGGTVKAHSAGLRQGCEFVVTLPSAGLPPKTTGEQACERPAPAARSFRILLVEDHEDSRESMRQLLSLWGHYVITAASGEEALASARGFFPDVAFVDVCLPGMNGFEVARRLRSKFNYPLLQIALTGCSRAADRQRAFDAGFDHHLVKPVNLSELENLLAAHSCKTSSSCLLKAACETGLAPV